LQKSRNKQSHTRCCLPEGDITIIFAVQSFLHGGFASLYLVDKNQNELSLVGWQIKGIAPNTQICQQ
jgi:hypothetical protein